MRSMDRVAGLKSDNRFPALFGKQLAGFAWTAMVVREGEVLKLEDGDRSAEQDLLLIVKRFDARMGMIGGAKNQFSFSGAIVLILFNQMENRQDLLIGGAQGNIMIFP